MRVEDTSYMAERARYGTEFRAAKYRRWFRKDGESWVFAGSVGHKFRIDTKTAASIYARGVDIEFDAISHQRLSFNLLVTLPFAALGMIPLAMLVERGITPFWLTAGIIYLAAAFALYGFTDWKLAYRQWQLRKEATEELIGSGVPQWRSIKPLHPRVFLFNAAMSVVSIMLLTALGLTLLDIISSRTLIGVMLVILVLAWLPVVWIERVKRELDQETDVLRGKQVASDHVVRRLGRKGRAA